MCIYLERRRAAIERAATRSVSAKSKGVNAGPVRLTPRTDELRDALNRKCLVGLPRVSLIEKQNVRRLLSAQ
jgi:hypothetical protein